MAKKKAARAEFNMSAEIRALLKEDPKLSGREIVDLLQQRNPLQKINRNSANVAFSNARRKLGIRPGAKSVRRRKPAGVHAPAKVDTVNLSNLKAARKFVAEVGSSREAIAAIQHLESLQLG